NGGHFRIPRSRRLMLDPSEDAALERALNAWRARRDPRPLERLLDQALDGEGVPRRWPIVDWWPILARLNEVDRGADDLFDPIDARLEGFTRAALRFSRPDGASVFSDERRPAGRGRVIADLVERAGDSGME